MQGTARVRVYSIEALTKQYGVSASRLRSVLDGQLGVRFVPNPGAPRKRKFDNVEMTEEAERRVYEELNIGNIEGGLTRATERHYSVQELAELWNFSQSTIRNLFRDEEGVLKIGAGETRYKRKRWQLSIPESVVIRVHKKRSN